MTVRKEGWGTAAAPEQLPQLLHPKDRPASWLPHPPAQQEEGKRRREKVKVSSLEWGLWRWVFESHLHPQTEKKRLTEQNKKNLSISGFQSQAAQMNCGLKNTHFCKGWGTLFVKDLGGRGEFWRRNQFLPWVPVACILEWLQLD